jgi:hypothetical protein
MMVDQLGWLPTLASGSAFAMAGAAMWLFIGVQRDVGAGQGLLAISQPSMRRAQDE